VIAESRTLRRLQNLFCAVQLLLPLEVALRGYRWLALAAVLCLVPLLWGTRGQPAAGTCLSWRAGQWLVHGVDGTAPVTLERWHRLAGVTFVAWRGPGGRRGRAWLFADSAPRDQLRRLRVRLGLERGV